MIGRVTTATRIRLLPIRGHLFEAPKCDYEENESRDQQDWDERKNDANWRRRKGLLRRN